MAVLVLGATGATGQLVVKDLLSSNQSVIALVRSPNLPPHPNLEQIQGTVLTLSEAKLIKILARVECIASCLGHNLTFKGIYGQPRMLVRDSIMQICQLERLIRKTLTRRKPLRIILMSSSGSQNLDLAEPISKSQKMALAIIRCLVPPHLDNERAANYLRCEIKNDYQLKWVIVRPDTLINEKDISNYALHASPERSAIFDPGTTSRINVANFMARLTREDYLFDYWEGKMPVIYNCQTQESLDLEERF